MLIVSQNKASVLNFDNVNLIGTNKDGDIKARLGIDDIIVLGKYKTEERAKEVLQEIYTYKGMFEFYKSNPMDKGLHEEMVNDFDKDNVLFDIYEMPEE